MADERPPLTVDPSRLDGAVSPAVAPPSSATSSRATSLPAPPPSLANGTPVAAAAPHPAKNPLAGILGLSPAETETLGRMFASAAGAVGLDGAFIFERLSRGEGLARALALPAGTNELLYARAHRWFAAGRLERAEPLFHALCLIEGSDADSWVGYGVCLKLRGAYAEALMAFEVAGRLRPQWAMPDFHALEVALRIGDEARARDCLHRFNAHADTEALPAAVHQEVARWTAALEMQTGRRAPLGEPPSEGPATPETARS